MNSLDLVIGPLYFLLILFLSFLLRPVFTDAQTRRYFLPALTFKMIAAISLGLLYQFYYVGEGGDTFGYYFGAKRIWEFFISNPIDAFRVIFWDGEYGNGIYKLVSRVPHHRNLSSFFVDRIAGFFGLFVFGNYSAIALLFAVVSFSGSWALYISLKRLYPDIHKWLAISILFIPSVTFWSSGILKDTLTFAGVCWMVWAFMSLVIFRKNQVVAVLVTAVSFVVIFSVKKYILMSLLPALLLWFYLINIRVIRMRLIRKIMFPLFLALFIFLGFRSVVMIGQDDARYSVDKLAETAAITAYDIRYYTGKAAGSGYSLGTLDGTWQSMINKIPTALNVSFYRPYLWEVANPLMLLLAIESTILLLLTLSILIKGHFKIPSYITEDPFVVFCLIFSISFAFAVGISTYNFGTLVRYKIPMMPFFVSFLVILFFKSRSIISPNRLHE